MACPGHFVVRASAAILKMNKQHHIVVLKSWIYEERRPLGFLCLHMIRDATTWLISLLIQGAP
jgi:hypothetical protein